MKRGKKAQMKLSFGMIFSIILIIIFIVFAIYAINKFLGIKKTVEVGKFVNDLQADVDKMWRSTQGSQELEYFLSSKIQAVCFTDDDKNLYFKSSEFMDKRNIEHIDIDEMTDNGKKDFCIDNINGKVKMTLQKEYGKALVMIKE